MTQMKRMKSQPKARSKTTRGKIFVVAIGKGGSAKTTTARHVSWTAAEKCEYRTCLVDLDPQYNATTTCINYAEANGINIPLVESDDYVGLTVSGLFDPDSSAEPVYCGNNLYLIAADSGIVDVEEQDLDSIVDICKKRIRELAKQFDLIVIDTSPSISKLLIGALSAADFVLSPCPPDRDAIEGLGMLMQNITSLSEGKDAVNPGLVSIGVLPTMIVKGRAYHQEVLNSMREIWGNAVLPVILYERAAIEMAKDAPVWQTSRGQSRSAAALEMDIVCEYILKRMGL